ncbi:hypothetical protein QQZ08_004693 [Neonectria magnoliae]|uniref:Uncharacterized protein n=1 Tax=Neonectria magnoliae TaxID=2732573 RepID=A0ABR1I5E4_9HYPO
MINNYDIIFRELFCMAASSLADRLREPIASVGVLWDEILPTGATGKRPHGSLQKNSSRKSSSDNEESQSENRHGADVAEKGLSLWEQDYGRGSLMFLVRQIEVDRDAERLVSEIIQSSMQIKCQGFDQKLRDMAIYTTQQQKALPGVHLGFFAIRARPNSLGFEILVRKGARNLLPSTPLSISDLADGQVPFLRRLGNLPVSRIRQILGEGDLSSRTHKEGEFAGQLSEAIRAFQEWIQEPLFEEATLSPTVVGLPYINEDSPAQSKMIVMRLVVPIHSVPSSPACEFVPLSFFKIQQVPTKFRQEFTRGVHREFGHIVARSESRAGRPGNKASGLSSKLWPFEGPGTSTNTNSNTMSKTTSEGRRGSEPDSIQSGSTINLCPPNIKRSRSIESRHNSAAYPARDNSPPLPPSYGGIMVIQEIKIDVEEVELAQGRLGTQLESTKSQDTTVAEPPNAMRSRPADVEMQRMGHMGTNVQAGQQSGDMSQVESFVDVLFAECVEGR